MKIYLVKVEDEIFSLSSIKNIRRILNKSYSDCLDIYTRDEIEEKISNACGWCETAEPGSEYEGEIFTIRVEQTGGTIQIGDEVIRHWGPYGENEEGEEGDDGPSVVIDVRTDDFGSETLNCISFQGGAIVFLSHRKDVYRKTGKRYEGFSSDIEDFKKRAKEKTGRLHEYIPPKEGSRRKSL